MHRCLFLCAVAAAPFTLSSVSRAGDLNPPVGPVGPTMKTLTEIEPRVAINQTNTPGDADSIFKITQPGSYYLTGNLTGVVGKSGIEIDSDNVSIDLQGFELQGIPGATAGIIVNIFKYSIRVHDGSIRDWPNHGIDGTGAYQSKFDNLRLRSNGVAGIRTAYDSILVDLIASDCTLGIYAGQNSTLDRCIVQTCSTGGVVAEGRVTINNCGFAFNGSASGPEIRIFGSGTVSNCTIAATRSGILGGDNIVVQGCVFTSGTNEAIRGGICTLVRSCTISFAATDGISVGDGSLVSDNTIWGSRRNGIVVANGCLVQNNNVYSAGWSTSDGAGILVNGIRNRIVDNLVSNCDRGIDIDGIGNLIIRNSASANTNNYDIVAGNSRGQIINIVGAIINTHNSWANVVF